MVDVKIESSAACCTEEEAASGACCTEEEAASGACCGADTGKCC